MKEFLAVPLGGRSFPLLHPVISRTFPALTAGRAYRRRAKAEIDPLFTMRCERQLVATHGNGFRLFLRFPRRSDLPLIAIGCNHGAPYGLHPL
jgi:hypothetical protein